MSKSFLGSMTPELYKNRGPSGAVGGHNAPVGMTGATGPYGATEMARERPLFMFQKRHYRAMVAQMREVEAALPATMDGRVPSANVQLVVDEVMELVIARLGLMCATDNPMFDSFEFNAACRGRRT